MSGFKSKLNKAKEKLSDSAKQAGNRIVAEKNKLEEKHQERKQAKQLEKDIFNEFKNKALQYKLITEGERITSKIVFARTNYDGKLLTLFGEHSNLKGSYFVDVHNQKFMINLIRQNQSIEVELEETVYTRPATVIEFEMHNDEKTKSEMIKIVNTSINISDSKIVKSNLGNE